MTAYTTTARTIAEAATGTWHDRLPRNPDQLVHHCWSIYGRTYRDGSPKRPLHVVLVDGQTYEVTTAVRAALEAGVSPADLELRAMDADELAEAEHEKEAE